ncbi:MAG TPA: hypothetical protein VMM78_18110 [Thermomicrobiales bacterium]|nr:hypothetical protein [Thermomicrobiales bacterium]
MATAHHSKDHELPEIVELTPEEGRQLFDERARELVGMSGEEFLRKWDASEIEDPDRSHIVRLVMMIPFCGRPITLRAGE